MSNTTAVRIRKTLLHPVASAAAGRRLLLVCGILSSLLYGLMLVVVPSQYAGYSSASGAVSELSAIDSPTRSLWVSLAFVWTLLYAAFGWGVCGLAGGSRRLRVLGGVIIASAVFGLFWPPMHQREVLAAGGGTVTDMLHIVWTIVNGLFTLAAIGLGAAALGGRFRLYSIATIFVLVISGAMTGTYTARMEANLPTPGMGVWERLDIGAWLLWVLILAIALLRYGRAQPQPLARERTGMAGAISGGTQCVMP